MDYFTIFTDGLLPVPSFINTINYYHYISFTTISTTSNYVNDIMIINVSILSFELVKQHFTRQMLRTCSTYLFYFYVFSNTSTTVSHAYP